MGKSADLRQRPGVTNSFPGFCPRLVGGGGWLLAWPPPPGQRRGAFLACAAGATIIVAWVVVFPTHTFGHGWFMVRMMLAPLALGWVALLIEARVFASAGSG